MTEPAAPTVAGVEAWYRAHHAGLVRLATLATGDPADGEEIVQDLFARLHHKPPTLADPSRPLPYLRSAVLNNARTRTRRRSVGRVAHLRVVERDSSGSGVEDRAVAGAHRQRVLDAVHRLPRRQRDVVLLRYWLELSEAEIADTLGISAGTVKSSASRAMAALAPVLEDLR